MARSAIGRFYEREVMARLLDRAMGGVDDVRAEIVRPLTGRVLEIGFGTGATLPHYGPGLTELVAVEPASELAAIARRRLVESGRAHQLIEASATRPLPLDAASFDAVVVAFVLCSVERTPELLAEVRRLLKPGAPLVLAEHVEGEGARRRAQHAIRPIWKPLLGGCDPAKDTASLVRAAGFDTRALERRELSLPWIVRSGLVGRATRE